MADVDVDALAQAIANHEGYYTPGTIPARYNNPGALRPPGSTTEYVRFESPEAGWDALRAQIKRNLDRGLNLNEFFGGKEGVYAGYAPASDKNNPQQYAAAVASRLKISPTEPLKMSSADDDLPPGARLVSEDELPPGAKLVIDYPKVEAEKKREEGTFYGRFRSMVDPRPLLEDPIAAAKAIALQPGVRGNQAIEAFRRGDYRLAAGRALEAIPVIGGAAEAGERIAEDLRNRNYQGAAGTLAGLLGPNFASKLIPKNTFQLLPKVGANPTVVNAMQDALSEGVPVSLAAATDAPFLKGIQEMSDATLLGSIGAAYGKAAERTGLKNWAEKLQVQAKPATPVKTAYADWDAALADPANVVSKQVGVKQVPSGRGVNLQGQPLTTTVPVMENITLPVDISPLKASAQKFIDARAGWPLAMKDSDQAYALAKMIVESKKWIPAEAAEHALSGLKSRLRELGTDVTTSTAQTLERSQASSLGQQLQQAIERDVGAVAPDAVTALKKGRAAAARQVGSEWLQELIDKASATGNWDRADWAWSKWRDLDPIEKNTMFPNPAQREHLDNLFLASKRAANVSGGSRTAPLLNAQNSAHALATAALYGGTGLMGAITTALGPAAVSALMRNPRFVGAMINGFRAPVRTPAQAAIITNQLLKLAADEGYAPQKQQQQ